MVDLEEIQRIQLNEFKFHLLKVLNKYRMLIKVKDGVPIVVKTDKKNRIMDANFVNHKNMRLELASIMVKKNEATRKANRKADKIRSEICGDDH